MANRPVTECVWTHQDSGTEYSAEKSGSSQEWSVEVLDSACTLTFNQADHDKHDGFFDVQVKDACGSEAEFYDIELKVNTEESEETGGV